MIDHFWRVHSLAATRQTIDKIVSSAVGKTLPLDHLEKPVQKPKGHFFNMEMRHSSDHVFALGSTDHPKATLD